MNSTLLFMGKSDLFGDCLAFGLLNPEENYPTVICKNIGKVWLKLQRMLTRKVNFFSNLF